VGFKTDSIKDQNDNYYIMLPVHANNGTVVTKTSVPYNKVPTAESTVFLLKLVGILAICSTKSQVTVCLKKKEKKRKYIMTNIDTQETDYLV
jgi:hypothetical protein